MLFPGSRHLWRVWRAGFRASMTRELAFRANFILGLLRQLINLGTFIFTLEIIFQNTPTLAGWSKADALVIIALSRFLEGLINTFFGMNFISLPDSVQTGKFDFNLTRPVSVQFFTAFRTVSFYSLGNVIAGLALLLYAMWLMPLAPSLVGIVLFVILAALGLIVYYSLLLLSASLSFYLERLEALWGFWALFSEPLTVPFDIFPRVPRFALTYLLPLALVTYVPAQALTGRLQAWQVPVAFVLTAFFLLLANLAWRAGLKRYTSASS